MNAVSVYSFTSLAWLSVEAIPLIIWPALISSLLSVDVQRGSHIPVNEIQEYFARSLGFAQIAVGFLIVVLSGALPLTSLTVSKEEGSPYTDAVVLISMFYHAWSGFYAYLRYNSSQGQVGFLLGALGSGALATFGLWILLFADDKGHISRRTGADKRTSGFPFDNREADKKRVPKKQL
ncbi:hypothetical protein QBC37DRAFT_414278 [Rhypophila decipiens]|uniref:Uncharacterized protein n=1 Tax=Rhypophila decipiens TaxID=261697 RepID=A0AAN6YFR6_9PEZI|nr:hypothetical protein QBC37DRAFT_414278 [Rhypophila decipiens]